MAANSANAVRITARRTKATGNAVTLYFASLLGYGSFDVVTTSIASRTSYGGGYIGLNLTRMYNTAHFDAYNSTLGPYSASSAMQGNLLSFKDMWLYNYSSVYGEAHWDVSGIFNHDSTAIVSPGPMNAQKLGTDYPAVSAGNVASSNDNSKLVLYYSNNQLMIPNGRPPVTYPGGTYYFTNFNIGTGNQVYFSGPTIIYLNCGGQIQSTLAPSSLRPMELAVRVTPTNNWTIGSGGVFYGSFYNPTGAVHHHNGGVSYGSVISSLLCFRQTSQGHQDLSMGKYASAAGVVLVK